MHVWYFAGRPIKTTEVDSSGTKTDAIPKGVQNPVEKSAVPVVTKTQEDGANSAEQTKAGHEDSPTKGDQQTQAKELMGIKQENLHEPKETNQKIRKEEENKGQEQDQKKGGTDEDKGEAKGVTDEDKGELREIYISGQTTGGI